MVHDIAPVFSMSAMFARTCGGVWTSGVWKKMFETLAADADNEMSCHDRRDRTRDITVLSPVAFFLTPG
jgi:hypothetical protein